MKTATGQRTFGQLREEMRAPAPAGPGRRETARQDALDVAHRAARSESPARQAALDAVDRELRAWIARLGVGRAFQSADFNEHLLRAGLRPDPALVEPRSVGGLIIRLRNEGVIACAGYRSNAGSELSNYNATTRPVWRIVRLPGEPGPEGSAA